MKYSKINDDFLQVLERIAQFREDSIYLKDLQRLINELDSLVKQFSLLDLYLIDREKRF
jgi:hypothetical protein